MGRGLSALQRCILKIGLEARLEGCWADRGWPDVYHLEVLVEHFGWPGPDDWHARRNWADTRRWCTYPYRWETDDRIGFLQNEPGKIPWGCYSHRAALSRAIARLEARGLAKGDRFDAGHSGLGRQAYVNLTPAGVREAHHLVQGSPWEGPIEPALSRFDLESARWERMRERVRDVGRLIARDLDPERFARDDETPEEDETEASIRPSRTEEGW